MSPGKGGEIQLTDAIALLLAEQTVYGRTFTSGRFDTGNKLDYLKATVERPCDAPTSTPCSRPGCVTTWPTRRST